MKLKNLAILLIALLSSCQLLYREIRYYQADITDHEIFPFTEINTGDSTYYYTKANADLFDTLKITYWKDTAKTLEQILEPSSTHAFLVIRNDSILFEKYAKGYLPNDISTFFSVSKSVTSLLLGIAIDEGHIDDVNDPITKYIPELKGRAPQYERLTLQHLLDMRSGMAFKEEYNNPLTGMASLYYGRNQLAKLKRIEFDHEPGTVHDYQSSSTALLGIAIENATGKELGKYLEEKVWRPMGMEYMATWSVDDNRHRSTKAYCGLNATAIDLAKIGSLYLKKGNWQGKQIVSEEWVKRAETPNLDNEGYRDQWWSIDGSGKDSLGNYFFPDSLAAVENMTAYYEGKYSHYKIWKDKDAPDPDKQWRIRIYTNCYFALGIMKQVLYIDPDKDLVMVRLGANGDNQYFNLMYTIGKQL